MRNIYKQIPLGRSADLSNQQFGLLTAKYRTENRGTRTMWVCECECGVVKPVPAQDLTQHKTISCGCQNRAKASQRMLEYNLNNQSIQLGDKFGLLEVIEYEGLRKQNSRNKNESWYICKCQCGTIKPIRGNDLQTGAIISCGCVCSVGEMAIKNILNENNIYYKTEFIFSDLVNPKTNRCLRFDFAIFDDNYKLQYLIEFDGRQHFTGPEAGWSHAQSLEDIQYKDNLKNQYCKTNGIILKRIPYTALSHLSYEEIISNIYNI